jgi:RNA polymerase sigma factor (sigma-70 family)
MTDSATEGLLRELAPQVLGALARRWGDFARCEDAVQEALLAAVSAWAKGGLPDDPKGWLLHAAQNRLVDSYRSEVARRRREEFVAVQPPPGDVSGEDDTLVLLLLCCSPALSAASAVALTLRAVGGLTTAQIAAAFLVPEATMAQRISRAKQRLRKHPEPFAIPPPEELPQRLRLVLHVLYLIFNEGYTSSGGDALHHVELSAEAIRLTRLLHQARPDDGEVTGLLALMLLTDARRPARTGPGGVLVPSDQQNRSRWDTQVIAEGVALAARSMAARPLGEYQLQAAIAALHDQAPSTAQADWPRVLALYEALETLSRNPIVTLNKAVAVAMVDGPDAALRLIESLEAPLAGNHRLDAVRAHLHEMRGDLRAAGEAYARAAARTTNAPERDYLTVQAARVRAGSVDPVPPTPRPLDSRS